MKNILFTTLALISLSCSELNKELKEDVDFQNNEEIILDSSSINNQEAVEIESKPKSVLVLIPYDEIANAGRSPNIQQCLESEFRKIDSFDLRPFPFKKLMGVPYQMVYDKKYCKSILEKVTVDYIIMSKLCLLYTSPSPRD